MLYLTAVHDERQLGRFRPSTFLGRRRRIAIDLIDAVDALNDPDKRAALFGQIVDARGVFKRTYLDRFAAFDARLIALWREHGGTERPVRILDAAVSDGSTALPLIELFRQATGGDFRYTATDLDGAYVKLWRRGRPRERVILSAAGEIVQIVRPPFVHGRRESRRLFPLNRALRPAAERLARDLVAAAAAGDPEVERSEILLLHPELRAMIAADDRVAFRSWDILQPWPGGKAHCVRAMNILNPGYFDADGLARIVANLFAILEDGGLLAMGSNEGPGSPVDGVICRREGARLVELAISGGGFRAPAALAPHLSATGTY